MLRTAGRGLSILLCRNWKPTLFIAADLFKFPQCISFLDSDSDIFFGRGLYSPSAMWYGTALKNNPISPLSAIRHKRPENVSSMNWSLLESDIWPKTNLPFGEDKTFCSDCGDAIPSGCAKTDIEKNNNEDININITKILPCTHIIFCPPLWDSLRISIFDIDFFKRLCKNLSATLIVYY